MEITEKRDYLFLKGFRFSVVISKTGPESVCYGLESLWTPAANLVKHSTIVNYNFNLLLQAIFWLVRTTLGLYFIIIVCFIKLATDKLIMFWHTISNFLVATTLGLYFTDIECFIKLATDKSIIFDIGSFPLVLFVFSSD